MKIYIVTDRDCNVPVASFDQNLARKDLRGRYCHTLDIDVDIDFLEATLQAKKLEAEMFEQRNTGKITGLRDMLKCTREQAIKILKEHGNENTKIHKPDEPV